MQSIEKNSILMTLMTDIKAPVLNEMQLFNQKFNDSFQSENPLLSSVNEFVRQGSGKQLRPLVLLLAAKMCGEINEITLECAVSLELLHTASLIHDDVVDDTMERRGRKSVNAQWDNKVAVLTGDYMLSNALNHAAKTNNMRILELICKIGTQLSDGELLQLINANQVQTTEKEYFEIIRKKTAILFSTCAELGAVSVNALEDKTKSLRHFGEFLGICFQLKDDVFDYSDNIKIGKPTGNDIREGKITLPLIYALKEAPEKKRNDIIAILKSKDFSPENIAKIISFAKENRGIDYAEKQMEIYKNKAIAELDTFPDSPARNSLIMCAKFAVNRDN